MKKQLKKTLLAISVGALALTQTPAALASGPIAPAITVNDEVITGFELDQRARMLAVFNAPGSSRKLAREQLIEERLKLETAKRLGLEATAAGVEAGMEEFAQRASMTTDQFLAALRGAGVEPETYRDFIENGVLWREVVGVRFRPRVNVTEDEVDRAMKALNGGSSVQVLLSEIIMAVPQGETEEVMARAERISEITSTAQFSAEARKYSAAATRDQGGRLNWTPLTQLPAPVRPIVLALAPGQVSDPIPLPDAVALFQMRAIKETGVKALSFSAIEYATYLIPGGRSDKALTEAAKIKADVDTCDDLYGIAKGQPDEVLTRKTQKPGEIPSDIALELAKLDTGEVSTTLTRTNGQTLVFLMMCGRSPTLDEQVDRETVRQQLQNQRLQSLAEGYIQELKADARIVEQ